MECLTRIEGHKPSKTMCVYKSYIWVAVKVNIIVKVMRMTAISTGQEILEIFRSHLSDIYISAA
jgi:hypothetical protein